MGANCLGGTSKVVTNNSLLNSKITTTNHNINKQQSNQKDGKISNKLKVTANHPLNETGDSEELSNLKLIRATNDSLTDMGMLESALKKQFFMRSFDNSSLIEIIKQIPYYAAKKDSVIYDKGAVGNYFFVIHKGSVQISNGDVKEKLLGQGDYFGELALIQEAKRPNTATAVKETFLYCLERKDFRNHINKINQDNFEENKAFVQSIAVLSRIILVIF